jgi:hypothetical protein
LTAAATPVSVDLTGWIENGFKGNNGAGTWTVQSGNDSVIQSLNGDPTVFFKPGENAQGTQLSGTITSNNGGDDDFIGFVLGYQSGELNSTSADFWLIDWKQGTQTFGGVTADVGLSLSHVTGDIAGGPNATNSFWGHDATVTEVQRATNLGSTGWATGQTYTFDLVFTSSLIEVFVDGVKELSYSGSFTDGAFGFYNYSQSNVTYAGITEEAVIPLPASLPLLLAGLGVFGVMRCRKG